MRKLFLFLMLPLALFLFACTPGKNLRTQPASVRPPAFLQAKTYQAGNLALPYRWLSPLQTQLMPKSMRRFTPGPDGKYPLVIFLHGYGECGDDNRAQLSNGIEAFWQPDFYARHPHFFLAPQCPKGMRWSKRDVEKEQFIFDTPAPPMEALMQLIETALRENPAIDRNRIYLTGLSIGGMGTFDLLVRRPDWFAAAIPICGGSDPDIAPDIRHIAIWVFHGSADDVVPVKYSRRVVMALRQAGSTKIGYTEYPGWGHNTWDDTYGNPVVLKWLFRQRREAEPGK